MNWNQCFISLSPPLDCKVTKNAKLTSVVAVPIISLGNHLFLFVHGLGAETDSPPITGPTANHLELHILIDHMTGLAMEMGPFQNQGNWASCHDSRRLRSLSAGLETGKL